MHFNTIMNNYYQFSVKYEFHLEWAKHQKRKNTQNRHSNEHILETNSSRIKYKLTSKRNQRDLEMQTYILNGEQANKVQVGPTSKAHEGTEKQDVWRQRKYTMESSK